MSVGLEHVALGVSELKREDVTGRWRKLHRREERCVQKTVWKT
jgi:KaiC/GvpD/RAD55 family RecA-like ATPase